MTGSPARFSDAGDFAVKGHLPELIPAKAELAHIAFRAAGQFAAVVQADRIGIAGKLVEFIPATVLLELLAQTCIFRHHSFPLFLSCDY